MIIIAEASEARITRLTCPYCQDKLPRVGLRKDSKIEGLTFKCRKCGRLWEVKTE